MHGIWNEESRLDARVLVTNAAILKGEINAVLHSKDICRRRGIDFHIGWQCGLGTQDYSRWTVRHKGRSGYLRGNRSQQSRVGDWNADKTVTQNEAQEIPISPGLLLAFSDRQVTLQTGTQMSRMYCPSTLAYPMPDCLLLLLHGSRMLRRRTRKTHGRCSHENSAR